MPDAERANLVEVYVNSRPKEVPHGRISYEDLLKLAFPGETLPPTANITITFLIPENGKTGILVPGESTAVHKGMSFNVKRTDKS
jgi:hypothetical protein